jgi:hypothetical protein
MFLPILEETAAKNVSTDIRGDSRMFLPILEETTA